MELNYKKYGEQGRNMVILHGLFGMLDNWHTLATRFGQDFQVWAIDQRNHGKSPHSHAIDYPIMAQDLADFFGRHGIAEAIVIGHSMGGKVAMQFALDNPDLVTELIVVDIAPKAYQDRGQEALIAALNHLDLSKIQRRSDADEALKKEVPEESTRQFLLKNLAREGEHYVLKMNLKSLSENYPKLAANIDAKGQFNKPTLFIHGERSTYIQKSDLIGIKKYFPSAQFTVIPSAGHWVNADAPDAFYAAVMGFVGGRK